MSGTVAGLIRRGPHQRFLLPNRTRVERLQPAAWMGNLSPGSFIRAMKVAT
ncbi:MAG: hypothetical protein AAGA65_26865 [Actinomycetota bacterium]